MLELYGRSPKMYDRDKSGKLKESTYTIFKGPDSKAKFVQTIKIEGLKDKVFETVVDKLKTKTALESAVVKVNFKLRLMTRKGWVTDPTKVGGFVFKPMLLEDYEKHKSKVKFPCIIQPKLDGVRCLYDKVHSQLVSRGSKIYELKHITDVLKGTDRHLDGELYVPDTPLQDIVSMVKQGDERVQFYLFDMPSTGLLKYQDRLKHLVSVGHEYKFKLPNVHFIATNVAYCHDDIEEYHDLYLKDGFEGTVVKALDGHYRWNDRSVDVLKYKPTYSQEYKITDVSGDNLSTGGKGICYICKTSEEKEFKVIPKASHNKRREDLVAYEKGEYNPVGKLYTVEYKSLSKDNIPTNGVVGIQVRDYE